MKKIRIEAIVFTEVGFEPRITVRFLEDLQITKGDEIVFQTIRDSSSDLLLDVHLLRKDNDGEEAANISRHNS